MSDHDTALADVRAINGMMREKMNQMSAALTAAAERETTLREENERLRLAVSEAAETIITHQHIAESDRSALAAERQKVMDLVKQIDDAELFNRLPKEAIRWIRVELVARGLTPDPPREK